MVERIVLSLCTLILELEFTSLEIFGIFKKLLNQKERVDPIQVNKHIEI